jgi:nucleoside phosphorylase
MLLICAAVIEELQPLLIAGDFKQAGENLFKHNDRPVLIAALGVGLVDFASGLQGVLCDFKIDKALLTGTCGVYPEALAESPLGTLVVPEKISLGDLSVVEKSGYFPAPVTQSCILDKELFCDLLPNLGGHCLTLATITADDQVAVKIAGYYRAEFEQMEAYAFARLCQINQVRGTALFAVVNQVGSQGHAQWRANAHAGAITAADLIRERFNFTG